MNVYILLSDTADGLNAPRVFATYEQALAALYAEVDDTAHIRTLYRTPDGSLDATITALLATMHDPARATAERFDAAQTAYSYLLTDTGGIWIETCPVEGLDSTPI